MSKGERSILVSHRVCVDEIMLEFVDLNKIELCDLAYFYRIPKILFCE